TSIPREVRGQRIESPQAVAIRCPSAAPVFTRRVFTRGVFARVVLRALSTRSLSAFFGRSLRFALSGRSLPAPFDRAPHKRPLTALFVPYLPPNNTHTSTMTKMTVSISPPYPNPHRRLPYP